MSFPYLRRFLSFLNFISFFSLDSLGSFIKRFHSLSLINKICLISVINSSPSINGPKSSSILIAINPFSWLLVIVPGILYSLNYSFFFTNLFPTFVILFFIKIWFPGFKSISFISFIFHLFLIFSITFRYISSSVFSNNSTGLYEVVVCILLFGFQQPLIMKFLN